MEKIKSFQVNHDLIVPGIYISRIDGDITTFDLRTRMPNAGDYMDDITMHSIEHMLATCLRNGKIADRVIYFGPMGCQTGFYLLVRSCAPNDVLAAVRDALCKTLSHNGKVFGSTRKECGNYKNLSIAKAKKEAARYLKVLENGSDFKYREK